MVINQKNDALTYQDEAGNTMGAEVVRAITEPNFLAAGVTPVTGSLAAPGNTLALPAVAGRQAYLTLSGGTSLTGAIQWDFGDGAGFASIDVGDGTKLGLITYIGTTMRIPIPTPDKASVQIRLAATAVSGTVTYTLSQ